MKKINKILRKACVWCFFIGILNPLNLRLFGESGREDESGSIGIERIEENVENETV